MATIREFCLLRAQSVTGQLDGTIPFTSEDQSADSSSLVDASCIILSNMGTMSRGMGGGRGEFGGENRGNRGGGFTEDEGVTPEQGNTGGFPQPPGGMEMPDMGNMQPLGGMEMSDVGNMQLPETESSAEMLPLLIISLSCLMEGLLAVYKYKR